MTTADALIALRRETGRVFTEVAPLPGGDVSHATVVFGGAGRSVLKWWRPAGGENDSLAWLRRAAARVETLRRRGYPAPAYEVIAERDGILLVLQELLPGRPPTELRWEHVEQLTALNGLQEATQADDPAWGAYLVRTLLEGGDGYCLHEPLRTHSPAAAALLDRVVAVGRATSPSSLPAADMAHLDFHHLNVLVDDGAVTGVIDCEGIRPGDRAFDLVTLLFCSEEGGLEEAAQERLWEQVLGMRPRAAIRAYMAHMALRLASWSIVHHDHATAERWIAHGRRWLDSSA
jgi:Phosphotransferase enzyme family